MTGLRVIGTGDKIVIKKDKLQEETAGGILLPGEKDRNEHVGIVVSVGPIVSLDRIPKHLRVSDDPSCLVGQMVVYRKLLAETVYIDGDEIVIVDQQHLMAVISL